ncbi:MAG: transcription antitermination factor NusB [Candidatus Kapabacteria bacterium]|nr:transcription antitermination factor NusB [Candidatus Kapabacteria bacterium]
MKKKPVDVNANPFPLSTKRKIDGSRRLAREKVLQLLVAYTTGEDNRQRMFEHIFFRDFTIDDPETPQNGAPKRMLRPEEIADMEADTPIIWREKDIEFARILLDKTTQYATIADDIIERLAKNWELDRIALIDRQILTMTITEMIECKDIPTKVSINEALEVGKRYSTEKSNVFLNGILDAACEELVAAGKIIKEGRGLQGETPARVSALTGIPTAMLDDAVLKAAAEPADADEEQEVVAVQSSSLAKVLGLTKLPKLQYRDAMDDEDEPYSVEFNMEDFSIPPDAMEDSGTESDTAA